MCFYIWMYMYSHAYCAAYWRNKCTVENGVATVIWCKAQYRRQEIKHYQKSFAIWAGKIGSLILVEQTGCTPPGQFYSYLQG